MKEDHYTTLWGSTVNTCELFSTVGEFCALTIVCHTIFCNSAFNRNISIKTTQMLHNSAKCKPGTDSAFTTDAQVKSCSRWLDAAVVADDDMSAGFCSIREFSIASSQAETDSGVLITLHREIFTS